MRVIELGRDPDANLTVLTGLLARDPAMASRILRVCNSPLYAQRRATSNLHQAVMLIGMNATMTLALSFSLTEVFRSKHGDRMALERIWRRALISAQASRLIGARLRLGSLDELYLAGLLQDLGILALHAAMPERYSVLLTNFESHDQFLEVEREALETDHGEAGAWLMRHWGLPERLVLSATATHAPDESQLTGPALSFMHCVALAGHVAEFLLSEGKEATIDVAANSAERWFDLDQESLQEVIQEIVLTLPEVAKLFELEILSPRMASGLIDQARELLATRNLRLIHQASEHQQKMQEMRQTAKMLEEAASHDALTGLHNRRHFDQMLEMEFTLATDNGWPLTLGLLDLDWFKQINDTQGHLVGDAVLIKVAAVLKQNLRERDHVMRYGGEEFVVLLPGLSVEDAITAFERLRAAVGATDHSGEDGKIFHVTTSIGLASHMDGVHCIEDGLQLIRAADRALYDAKRQGRNCIQIAP